MQRCCTRAGVHQPDVILTDVAAIKKDLTSLHVIKSLNQKNYAALAAAAGPDKCHTLLRLDDKVEIVKDDGVRARGVGEANVFELDAAF